MNLEKFRKEQQEIRDGEVAKRMERLRNVPPEKTILEVSELTDFLLKLSKAKK